MGNWWRGYAYAPTRWVAGVAGGVGLGLAGAGMAAAGPWQGGQREAERAWGRAQSTKLQVAGVKPKAAGPQWHAAADVLPPAAGTGTAPLEVRHRWRKRNRIAEISVPA